MLLKFNKRAYPVLLRSSYTTTTMSTVKKQLIVFDFDWYALFPYFYEPSS